MPAVSTEDETGNAVHLSFRPHITLCLTLAIGQSGSQSARAVLGKYLAMALPTRYPLPSPHLTTTNAYMLPTSGTSGVAGQKL